MGNAASNTWAMNYRLLKGIHDDAYKHIDRAITLEEQEQPNQAIEAYKAGILTIDKALDVVIACPDNPDDTWRDACTMVQKMKQSRAEVLQRINAITSSPDFVQMEPPPMYDHVVDGQAESHSPERLRTYSELAEALDNLKIITPQGEADILISCDNVVQYFISPNGNGTVDQLEPQKMNIAILQDGSQMLYFLQIGNWIYPLVPGVSPCYRTEYRAFIFPDVHSAVEGASVGIVIPKDADALVLEILEDILLGVHTDEKKDKLSRQRRAEPHPQPGSSVASGLVTGAGYLSRGLIFTATKVGDLLNYGTPKVIANITPAQTSEVPTNVRKTLQIAEKGTGKAAEVTGVVASKIGVATNKLGQFLAPHIERQGTKLLTTAFNYTEDEASNRVNGVLTVAAGAVEGFGTVYQGLHQSAAILGSNLKDNSVKIVQHKYGESAGALANDTLGTVGNVISIRGNAKIFTPKGLAKSTIKQTGKAMIRSTAASAIMANAHASGSSNSEQAVEPSSGGGGTVVKKSDSQEKM
ncbi:protein spartin [Atheta coriaria]|uniref:protein spartin n=1 Tax=Dalotia coriaria TaxID=877792 RepID=UPI0031F361B9